MLINNVQVRSGNGLVAQGLAGNWEANLITLQTPDLGLNVGGNYTLSNNARTWHCVYRGHDPGGYATFSVAEVQ